MSDWIAEVVWKWFRTIARRHPKALTFAGPAGLVCIIANWIVHTILGYALIYWVNMHQATLSLSAWWTSLASSVETLSTISEGKTFDVPWLHIACGFEALIGFGIVSASISWLLSIYPIIESRRSLAHKATLLHQSEKKTGLDLLREGSNDASAIMISIAHDLSVLRNQMAQFPISYYFYVGEQNSNLSGILPYLADLANRSFQNDVNQTLRIPGTILGGAVTDFSILLARSFLHLANKSESEVLLAYAREQMCEPVSLEWRKARNERAA